MSNKENNQVQIVSAWAMSALQAMDECPQGGIEILEEMGKKIMESYFQRGLEIPMSAEEYVDIYDVPEIVFDLAEKDEELKSLNHKIKALNPELQKLLHFISKDHDPALIIESMEYSEPTEYWKKRGECLSLLTGKNDELDPGLKSRVIKVFERYEKIRDNFLFNTDVILKKNASVKNRRKWLITGILGFLIPLVFFAFIYPRLIQKDFQELFIYAVDKSGFEMTMDSTELMNEMIMETEEYSPERFWLLSLQSLQENDADACRDNLESLKATNRDMFKEKGRYIYRRLKR